MALSWKKNPDHPGGVVKAARQWKQDQQQSLKNYQLLKSLDKAHFVTYEDLTANNEVETRKILDFLGVPFDPYIFEFHKDEITRKNAGKQKAWNNLSQGVISNNSRKYLKDLNDNEIKAVEKICWYEMKHLGYVPEFLEKDLSAISDEWLESLHKEELMAVELQQSQGVSENMKAKASFYQR
jgi:hypothetical protein